MIFKLNLFILINIWRTQKMVLYKFMIGNFNLGRMKFVTELSLRRNFITFLYYPFYAI